MNDLNNILSKFQIRQKIESIRPYGSGHINDTYLAETHSPDKSAFILQKVNHKIFRDIGGLTNNILTVVQHVTKGLNTLPLADGRRFELPGLIPAIRGGYIVTDEDGAPWRMMNFIGGSHSYDRIQSREMAREAGFAFGLFHRLTSDMDPQKLVEVLPRFHHLGTRLDNFHRTIQADPAGRVDLTREEIGFVLSRSDVMLQMEQEGNHGQFPVRVTHNDTKINNILFDENNLAIAVIDLDTVMPGYLLYDFGDAIRTGASNCEEDEQNLVKAGINLDFFEHYTDGFYLAVKNFITPAEIRNLAFSARVMTFIIGLRFLTDHLDGDRYYKIARPGHNLHRAKVQFALLTDMESKFREMEHIVNFVTLH